MNNLNSVLIEGKMVRDPLLRTTPKGKLLCTFSLASNRFYRQESGYEREVSFFDVETWARLAEDCNCHGKKGRSVRVVGRLKQDRWNGSDGKVHSRVNIVAEHVEFRPEFSKESAGTAAVPVEEAAIEAAAYTGETPPIDGGNEDGGIPVMTEMLEPAVF
ncbi:MAG: single-stranded DNA-binding protein [Treponema sp.]|jgi:single-strand DNA-binding protein|nr:single-stranded DNA-binding protein [Treponema sp.]